MTLTLTRVPIDPMARAARKALSSPEVLHAIVTRSFGEDAAGRTLWRLDRGAQHHTLLMVGSGDPDRAVLAEQLGCSLETVATFSYERFLAGLATDQEWRFRLRANPTKAVSREGRRSQRRALHSEHEQLEWLIRQGTERAGFVLPHNRLEVPEVVIRARGRDEFRRGEGTVTLGTVVYDGILRVTEADALRQALAGGLGRGKAYGCGLLTLAPVGGLR